MNKEITIYELLGLVKDGKALKKILSHGLEYEFDIETKTYIHRITECAFYDLMDEYDDDLDEFLNDTVEIIEDNDKLEKINVKTGDNCKRFIEYDDETGHHKYTIRLLDEYFSKKINKIIGVLNERNMEKH